MPPTNIPLECTLQFGFPLFGSKSDKIMIMYLFRHSTGRGGVANLTPGAVPYIEVPMNSHATQEHEYQSTGRGGVGNIADRSRSREPRDPNNKDHGNGLTGFLHRVTHTGTQAGERNGVQGEVLTTGVDTRQPTL